MEVIRPQVKQILASRRIRECANFGCGQGHIFDAVAQMVLEKVPEAACWAVDRKAWIEDRFRMHMLYLREDIFETSLPDDSLDLLCLDYMLQAMWTKRGQRRLIELAQAKLQVGGYLMVSEIVRGESPKKNFIGHVKHVCYNGPFVAYNTKPLFFYESLLKQRGFSIQKVDYLGDGVVILARLEDKDKK